MLFDLRLDFAEGLVSELLRQLSRDLWLDLAQSSAHFIFLLLLLLNLAECWDCPLGNLMGMLNVVLQFLVTKVVGLFFRTKNLLLGCDSAIDLQIAMATFNLSHKWCWKRRLSFSTPWYGTVV